MTGTAMAIPATTSKQSFKTDVSVWAPQLRQLISTKGFTPERILAGAMSAALTNPDIFECDPTSIFLALAKAARLGLDIGESGLYLVPLNKKISGKNGAQDRWLKVCEGWVDYRGLKLLAIRAGLIRHMDEFVVYANDRFEYELGLRPRLEHKPTTNAEARGLIVGGYSVIERRGLPTTFHYMPIDEIEARRAKSKSWSPEKFKLPPAWWVKKATVRDYLGHQPKTPEMIEALAADDTAEETVDLETGEILTPIEGDSRKPTA